MSGFVSSQYSNNDIFRYVQSYLYYIVIFVSDEKHALKLHQDILLKHIAT